MAKPEDILAKVLSGELSREEAVRNHPDMEDRLVILSELVENLSELPRVQPDAAFRNAARLRLLQHIQASPHPYRPPLARLLAGLAGAPVWANRLCAVLLAGGALSYGVSFASASALPNDGLYPVKRAVEQVQVAVSFTNQAKANTYLGLADARAAELAAEAGRMNEHQLQSLAVDYGQTLQQMTSVVEHIATPPPLFIERLQAHVASQANELEAQAASSNAHPAVQQTLSQAEVIASNAADQVALASTHRSDSAVRLANNPPAAATAAAATVSVAQAAATPAPESARPTSSANSDLPSASGASSGSAATPYDRLWNEIDRAPFMGRAVRLELEQQVAQAKKDALSGDKNAAFSELAAVRSSVQSAVRSSQATQYTATRIEDQAAAIMAGLKPGEPSAIPTLQAASSAAGRTGLAVRISVTPIKSSATPVKSSATPVKPPVTTGGKASAVPQRFPNGRAGIPKATAAPATGGSRSSASEGGSALTPLFIQVTADVAGAPVMAPAVREALSQQISSAQAHASAGKVQEAIADLNASAAAVLAAGNAKQTTVYTAARVREEIAAIVAGLTSASPGEPAVLTQAPLATVPVLVH